MGSVSPSLGALLAPEQMLHMCCMGFLVTRVQHLPVAAGCACNCPGCIQTAEHGAMIQLKVSKRLCPVVGDLTGKCKWMPCQQHAVICVSACRAGRPPPPAAAAAAATRRRAESTPTTDRALGQPAGAELPGPELQPAHRYAASQASWRVHNDGQFEFFAAGSALT